MEPKGEFWECAEAQVIAYLERVAASGSDGASIDEVWEEALPTRERAECSAVCAQLAHEGRIEWVGRRVRIAERR